MQHLINKKNVALCFTRQCTLQDYSHNFITDKIVNGGFYASGINYIAPLYLYNEELGIESKIPNFKPEFLSKLKQILNPPLEGGPVALPSGWGLDRETFTPSPEQILGYIYAILNSPSYRKKYLEFLKIDFAKIPFNASIDEFKKLASLGQELIDAHLMLKVPNSTIGEPKIDEYSINPSLSIADKSYYRVTKPDYREAVNRLYFNDFCYFDSVSPAVWNFKIGGYQVLDKYLKSRKGLDISSDLSHIQNIIKILDFSVDRMAEVDGVLKI
jgi:predicted helicase